MHSLKDIIKNPSTVIIDVRSPWEFEMEHIPGAQNIPLEEVMHKVNEFKTLQNPIVLYCRSGARSGMAAGILAQNGIAQVYNGGGMGDIQSLLN